MSSYLGDGNRAENYPNTRFTFLGYDFFQRKVRNKKLNQLFLSFSPAVSKAAAKSMRAKVRQSGIRNRSDLSLEEIAEWYNPILRGWINYYGRYHGTGMGSVMRHFNKTLVVWAMRKYKKLKGHKARAYLLLDKIKKEKPNLFEHWKQGPMYRFA